MGPSNSLVAAPLSNTSNLSGQRTTSTTPGSATPVIQNGPTPSQTVLGGPILGLNTASTLPGPSSPILGTLNTASPSTTNTSSTTGASTPAGLAAFLAAAGLQSRNLNNDLGQANTMQQNAGLATNASYNDQMGGLNNQFNQGQSANQKSQYDLNMNHAQALSDLGSQLRGMYNNYMGQLGAAGAGSSSAADLVRNALGQQEAQGEYNLGTQNASQQTGLNQNVANLQANFQQQAQALNDWKTQTLQGIADQYQSTRQNLQNQILSVNTDQARTALYMQDQAAANQALQAAQQAVQSFSDASNGLQAQYNKVLATAPQASLNSAGYGVQQFTAPQLAGLSYQANQAQAAPVQAGIIANTTNTGNPVQPGTLASLQQ